MIFSWNHSPPLRILRVTKPSRILMYNNLTNYTGIERYNLGGQARNWRGISFNDVANETIQEGNYEKWHIQVGVRPSRTISARKWILHLLPTSNLHRMNSSSFVRITFRFIWLHQMRNRLLITILWYFFSLYYFYIK